MGMITIKFQNLCAFFTKKLADEKQLMVGLLDLSDFYDVPEKHWHTPKITIETKKKITNPNGEEILKKQMFSYEGFPGRCCGHSHYDMTRLISGDILMDVLSRTPGIEADGSAKSILDFEEFLHQGQPLKPNPMLCKARFHFGHGTLSGAELDDVNFAASDKPTVLVKQGVFALHAKLKIELPETDYAVLRFLNSDTEDFVFIGANDYEVIIDNAPAPHKKDSDTSHEHKAETPPNHFRFYYKLLSQPPAQQFEPMPEDPNPEMGDPFCMIGGFGKADFPLAFSDPD